MQALVFVYTKDKETTGVFIRELNKQCLKDDWDGVRDKDGVRKRERGKFEMLHWTETRFMG